MSLNINYCRTIVIIKKLKTIMMKIKKLASGLALVTIISMLTLPMCVYGLDYTISFTGSGGSTSVENVLVQNLTKGTTVTVLAGNVLNLTDKLTSIGDINSETERISIYPNSMQGSSTISFVAKQGGNVQIDVFKIDGVKVAGISHYVNSGDNSVQISLPKGVFIIHVQGNGFSYKAKAISQFSSCAKPDILFSDASNQAANKPKKNKTAVVVMAYTTGDQLSYKGYSAGYTSIISDVPTTNKNINFNFIKAMDIDENIYHTVTIGTQVWMVENLKVTKYSNGEFIPNVTDNTIWAGLSTGAYCDYNNLVTNSTKYGHLYNWFVVADHRQVAPQGWHVPTDEDWITLTEYLGGESVAGGKMKDAGNANWLYPNSNATNESGFSGLPSGLRTYNNGSFINVGSNGYFWSSSSYDDLRAYDRELFYNQANCFRYYYDSKRYGFSIRCVKN